MVASYHVLPRARSSISSSSSAKAITMSSLSTEHDMFIHEGETVSGEEKFSQDNSNANLSCHFPSIALQECRFKIIVTNGLSKLVVILADVGWCSVFTILPGCSANSAKMSSAQAESGKQRNCQGQSQPNQGPRADETPCNFCD